MIVQTFYARLNFSLRNLLDSAAGGTFMSLTLGAAMKLLNNMMVNYSKWHTERAPQGKKVNSVEETDTSQTYPSFLMLHAYFYTICLMFRYTSWHFYAFFGTNLLTSRHSASSLFLCFRKVTQEVFSKLDETKASRPDISRSFQRTEEEIEWGHEVASYQGGAIQPLVAPPMCETASVHF
jgi:hypothetical protein